MFSDAIRSALEREVIGQPQAVASVVRGVTRVLSGLTPRERSWCAYLLTGPTGTGKTHLVRSLARVVHGDDARVVTVDCTHFMHGDPWTVFVAQIAPLFGAAGPPRSPGLIEAPPLAIVHVEHLERAPAELYRALAAALESGMLLLPNGLRGRMRHAMIFFTSDLGSREILEETTRIGFKVDALEADAGILVDEVYRACVEQANDLFGRDFVSRLDGVIPFHRLDAGHLGAILDGYVARLDAWLRPRGFRVELCPAARAFLLERGGRDLRLGANELIRAHRQFVEFPLADLMISGGIPAGGLVRVDRPEDQEHLEFTVTAEALAGMTRRGEPVREVPVTIATSL